jgi:phosphoserine phosphatase
VGVCRSSLTSGGLLARDASKVEENMKRKVALLDWDASVRKDFTIRTWVTFLNSQNELPEGAVNEIQRRFHLFNQGKIRHDRLAGEIAVNYAKYMRNHSVEKIERFSSLYVLEDEKYLHSFSIVLFEKLKEKDIDIIVVSGAPVEILNQYKEKFSLKEVFGLELDVKNGAYTGEIKLNPGLRKVKQRIVNKITKSPDNKIILAVGNSESDIPLFRASSLSIVIDNPFLKSKSKVLYLSSDRNKISDLLMILAKEVLK